MINKKFFVVVIIFLSTLFIWIYVSIHSKQSGNNGLISPQKIFRSYSGSPEPITTSTSIILPTPTPIILDFSNELSKEVMKLTPEDFSSDFEKLKKSF